MRSLSFLAPDFERNPWPVYARLRAEQPVWWSPEIRMLCTFGHAETRHVLLSDEFTVEYPFRISQQVFGRTLLDMDGPEHQRLRSIVSRLFASGNVQKIVAHIIEPEVRAVLEALRQRARFDFMVEVAKEVPLRTTSRLLGARPEQRPYLASRLESLLHHLDGSGGDFASVSRAKQELEFELARSSSASGAECPYRGLADLSPELRPDEALRMKMLFLAAGVETSVCSIGNTLSALLRHPEWLDRAGADATVLGEVVREAVRWEPAQHDTVRFARVDTCLNGVQIPKGQAIKLVLASANRDERVFPEADRFLPGRDGTRTLSFGYGHHACLGRSLALLQIEVVLRLFFQSVRSVRLENTSDVIPCGNTFRQPASLPLVVEWHEPGTGRTLGDAGVDHTATNVSGR